MEKTKHTKQQAHPQPGYGSQPFKPVTSTVLECVCGTKYIKTRQRQTTCLKCMFNRSPYAT